MKTLCEHLRDYLELRRHLGFDLRNAGRELGHFVRFAERERAQFITNKLALEWAQLRGSRQVQVDRLGAVRGFARYLSPLVRRTEIPPKRMILFRRHRKAPYIYRDEEVCDLIKAARQLRTCDDKLRPHTYATLFGLLASTGMRISEAIRLDRGDVDLTQGLLTLRQTKDRKWRLVPVHPSVNARLRQYHQLRERICARPICSNFFVSERGTRLTYIAVHQNFIRLSHQIGLRKPTDHRGPRIHDLRHRFAVHTLIRWYRCRRNVELHLPDLTTYLGHGTVEDTYWYISAVPELLKLATERLEREQGGLSS